MPSTCFQNGLGLSEVPECLKLTDLENQLVAKNLVFIKIRPTPKSRYDIMNDRIVNVPISDDDIVKTIDTLPRSQNESGLVHVQLKRMLTLKNPYNEEMIRPAKTMEAVKYLKNNHTNIRI